MDNETKEILIHSVIEGGGDFHKSKKKFKELQKKKKNSTNEFEDMCKQILGFKK